MSHILPDSFLTGTLAFFCLEVELKHWLFLSLELPQPLDCNYTIKSPGGPACQLALQILGFVSLHHGSAGKESACNAGDLGSISGLGRSPREGKGYPLQEGKGYPFPVFWPGEFHGLYSPWGRKESDMTEQLSLLDSK